MPSVPDVIADRGFNSRGVPRGQQDEVVPAARLFAPHELVHGRCQIRSAKIVHGRGRLVPELTGELGNVAGSHNQEGIQVCGYHLSQGERGAGGG